MSSHHSLLGSSSIIGPRTRLRNLLACLHVGRSSRQLRLCESLSLGEKRLIAVIQYEGRKFLVGGGPQSVNLLADLGEEDTFSDAMTEADKG